MFKKLWPRLVCDMGLFVELVEIFPVGLFPLDLSNAFATIYGSGQTSLCFQENIVATAGKGRQ